MDGREVRLKAAVQTYLMQKDFRHRHFAPITGMAVNNECNFKSRKMTKVFSGLKILLFLIVLLYSCVKEKEKDEIWSKVSHGNEIKEYHLRIGEGIAGWVAKTGEIINLSNARDDKRFNPEYDKLSGYETKSMLCFPIKNKLGVIIGVIQLLNSKNKFFSENDEEFLNALSIHAALALENAALVEKLLQAERVSSLGKMANFLIQDIKKPINVP